MKDALGHGSNGRGSSQPTFGKKAPPLRRSYLSNGGRGPLAPPVSGNSSNADAARALMGALKSTMAPVHPSMQFGSDRAAPGPRPDITEALRQRSYSGTTNFGKSGGFQTLKRPGR